MVVDTWEVGEVMEHEFPTCPNRYTETREATLVMSKIRAERIDWGDYKINPDRIDWTQDSKALRTLEALIDWLGSSADSQAMPRVLVLVMLWLSLLMSIWVVAAILS